MKKLKFFAVLMQLCALLVAGSACQKIDDLESRVNNLEQTVSTLQALVNSGYFVSDYTQTEDGWTLLMKNGAGDSKTLNILNGNDGKDGADGKDGTNGEDGKDGKDGDSFFADVQIMDTYVVITLADGTSFVVPLDKSSAVTMIKSMILVPGAEVANTVPVVLYSDGKSCTKAEMEVSLNIVPSSAAEAIAKSLSSISFSAEFSDKAGKAVESGSIAATSIAVEGSVVTLQFNDSEKLLQWGTDEVIPEYVNIKVADNKGNDFSSDYFKVAADIIKNKISFTVNGITFNMVRIPAATFWMGSPMIDYYYQDDEILHQVKISKDYYLGEFEVTNQLYNSLISGHSSGWSSDPQQPVTDIWRSDAENLCAKLSEKLGVEFRLPTEAELEWAARGGDETGEKSRPFPLKDGKFDTTMANYMDGMYYDVAQLGPDWFGYVMKNPWELLADMEVKKVGSYAPNAYGLYDILGNVAEYCQDYYSAKFYKECAAQGLVVDPVNTTYDGMTVAKGGAFGSDLNRCRIPYHMPMMTDPIPPFMNNPTSGGGIRLCLTAE